MDIRKCILDVHQVRSSSLLFLIYLSLLPSLASGTLITSPVMAKQLRPINNHRSSLGIIKTLAVSSEGTRAEADLYRRKVTVRILNGEQSGSGIILRDSLGRVWVATNRHVIYPSDHVCIILDNGKVHSSTYIYHASKGYDLSFVQAKGLTSYSDYARIPRSNQIPYFLPTIATGYSAISNSYIETIGLALPILGDIKLEGGYSLAYTNSISKGMSGGGVFLSNGELLGLNALHADPLWRSEWRDSKGRLIDHNTSAKLDSISLGIDSFTIAKELASAPAILPTSKRADSCEKASPLKS